MDFSSYADVTQLNWTLTNTARHSLHYTQTLHITVYTVLHTNTAHHSVHYASNEHCTSQCTLCFTQTLHITVYTAHI